MAYYWVTEAQKYIQALGFGTARYRPVNRSRRTADQPVGRGQLVLLGQARRDPLGKGGVDDAEDAEVILHEYGHAVHDSQVPASARAVEAGRSARASATTWR
jgi:hypothetical protein